MMMMTRWWWWATSTRYIFDSIEFTWMMMTMRWWTTQYDKFMNDIIQELNSLWKQTGQRSGNKGRRFEDSSYSSSIYFLFFREAKPQNPPSFQSFHIFHIIRIISRSIFFIPRVSLTLLESSCRGEIVFISFHYM